MTKRLLFVSHSGVLGGAELSLFDIAKHNRRHATVVLLDDGPFREKLESAGVDTHVMHAPAFTRGYRRDGRWPSPSAVIGIVRVTLALARIARRYDVIYANSQKALVVSAIAGALSRRPVIWHLRDILNGDHFSRRNVSAVVTLANRFVARVIANSQATLNAFVARGGRSERICVVYNGIDPESFESAPEGCSRERQRLGIGAAPVVGVFSRLSPWKGQHVLLDALVHLPGIHAIFVGDALFGEEDYAADLHRRASTLGVADRAHFLGFRSDISRLMHLVDVVVLTSVHAEPFGRVIVEGMLAGVPVVATRDGGAAEIIRDGTTGILVAPGDARELSIAILSVLRTDRGAAISRAGHADARDRFTVRRMIDGVARVIEEVA